MDGPASNASNGVSRAEKFEDEKRRIVDSLFTKKDKDGSLLESYITHIRIIEDAAYPSSPPPPNSSADVKKPRVIIVAVRKSGRVLMHKARENANGTFSVGKTWPLDDLSAVESFSGSTPTTIEQEERKQWAGGVGFVVTIGKPYYWQANTDKEKQFFVASLVKIYTKYTGGKTPELVGFDDRERGQLLGSGPRPPPSAAGGTPRSATTQSAPAPPAVYGQSPERGMRPPPVRDPMVRPQPSREALPRQAQVPGELRSPPQISRTQLQPSRREQSPSSSLDYTGVTPQPSQSSLRKLASTNPSQESFSKSDSGMIPPRSRDGPNSLGGARERGASSASQRSMTPDSTISSSRQNVDDVPPVPAPLNLLPERRRPPIQGIPDIPRSRGRGSDAALMPAPLTSPSIRRQDLNSSVRPEDRPKTPVSESVIEPSPQTTPKPTDPTAAVCTGANAQASQTPQSMSTTSIEAPPEPIEDDRPGLGPMIKKKTSKVDVANKFRKAASAANAFKPRAGGAAERLRELGMRSGSEPDGITGVVPAPSLLRGQSNDSTTTVTTTPAVSSTSGLSKESIIDDKSAGQIPEVKITVAQSENLSPSTANNPIPAEMAKEASPAVKAEAREVRRKKPTSERTQKELATLGVDPIILDGRSMDFITLLDEFGWVGEGVHTRNIDEMRDDMEREINKVQAGGWLSRLEDEDDRIAAISNGIDNVIAEVEELDGLLTLYGVELGTLTDDVAYIEAQSQGLQVQAANQKLLQAEVQSLLDTISIRPEQLTVLADASLNDVKGIDQVEQSLIMLYKAMVTIDPSLSMTASGASGDGNIMSGRGGFNDSEIGKMRVLQEKKDTYRRESIVFLERLRESIKVRFGMAFLDTQDALRESSLRRGTKVDPRNHELAWKALWKYSPLMLFARQVDHVEWEQMLRMYENVAKPINQEEFGNALTAWKRTKRTPPPTTDDTEFIFTSQVEKQAEGLGRKLTVKATPSLGKLRSMGDLGGRHQSDKHQDGVKAWDVFRTALEEMSAVIIQEQNFIVEFFHISSIEAQDFPDSVLAAPPELRRGGDLRKPKPMDPNRDLAKKVIQSMEDLYSFWPGDMQSLIQWTIEIDPTQGVGVLTAIEQKIDDLEESSQEFLSRTLQRLHAQLSLRFTKFLEDQIRAIEDTKVKIKKRKGVIAFIRVFPQFSSNLESMLAAADGLAIRDTVNSAYRRIIKTMFDSLKVIARENPSANTSGASLADPEAKEALNYQILLIENMHHYIQEVETRNNEVLEEGKQNAEAELQEHLTLYIGAVVRRPLGKLIDVLDSTESRISSLPQGTPASTIANNQSHSKSKFQSCLASYDAKEIRQGIEALKGRVHKHFSHPEDPNSSRPLVAMVLGECQKYYENVETRITNVSTEVYEGDASFSWTRSDVVNAFKR